MLRQGGIALDLFRHILEEERADERISSVLVPPAEGRVLVNEPTGLNQPLLLAALAAAGRISGGLLPSRAGGRWGFPRGPRRRQSGIRG